MDNPSAFPSAYSDDPPDHFNDGMTLLDYFAGQALAGRMAAFGEFTPTDLERQDIAKVSYAVAAAMLNERPNHEH